MAVSRVPRLARSSSSSTRQTWSRRLSSPNERGEHYAAAPRVPNDRSDGARARQHGPVSNAGDRHHRARSQPLGIWPTVDRGSEQRRRLRAPLRRNHGAAAPADDRRRPPTDGARQAFESRYATVEITDSVAMRGGHQVALVRGYHDRLQDAVQALESDVLNGLRGIHEMTAILDKISAGELLARRQDMATNQLLSHALEAAVGAKQTGARHRGRDDQHAADDLARCGAPPTRRSSREPATRFARGVSRDAVGWKEVSPCVVCRSFTVVVLVVASASGRADRRADPAVTVRNAITAAHQGIPRSRLNGAARQLRRMARRLSRVRRPSKSIAVPIRRGGARTAGEFPVRQRVSTPRSPSAIRPGRPIWRSAIRCVTRQSAPRAADVQPLARR